VLLLDPLVGTGRTACRAVQVRRLQLCSLRHARICWLHWQHCHLQPLHEQVLLAYGLQQGQTLFLVMFATLDAVLLATAKLHLRTCLLFLQVLLARGVQQDKILFLSMAAAPEAIHKLCGTRINTSPDMYSFSTVSAGAAGAWGAAGQDLVPEHGGRS
jgi:hypothetical protein